jgi:Zn-dependent protease
VPLRDAVILFGSLVVAVILHEISHGVVALWCGDDTAKRAGRLTLNPVPHVDPIGSIALPAIGALSGLPILAFARPVPVSPARMRHPRRDMVLVGLAGPTTNLLLMAIAALVARGLVESGQVLTDSIDGNTGDLAVRIVFFFAVVNLLLGLFNLLPIPPLDGSALVERLLPEAWLPTWFRIRPFGIFVLLALVLLTGVVSEIVSPFYDLLYDFVVPRS